MEGATKMKTMITTAKLPNSSDRQLFLVPDLPGWFEARRDFENMGLLFMPSQVQPSRARNCIRVDWSIKQFALTGLDEWEKEVQPCD